MARALARNGRLCGDHAEARQGFDGTGQSAPGYPAAVGHFSLREEHLAALDRPRLPLDHHLGVGPIGGEKEPDEHLELRLGQ